MTSASSSRRHGCLGQSVLWSDFWWRGCCIRWSAIPGRLEMTIRKLPVHKFANMICFGSFLDLILWWNLVPEPGSIWTRLIMFLIGVVVMTIGIGMYLSPRLGAGPRDSFMLAMNERLGWSIQKVRLIIEITVLLAGAALGGPVSIGTVLIAILTSPLIQRTIPFWQMVMKKQYDLIEPVERQAG